MYTRSQRDNSHLSRSFAHLSRSLVILFCRVCCPISVCCFSLSTSARVELALKYRLEAITPYISIWPQALALATSPRHAATSLCKLHAMIDDIWYLCGDKSTDVRTTTTHNHGDKQQRAKQLLIFHTLISVVSHCIFFHCFR